jgi:hypothetical protein
MAPERLNWRRRAFRPDLGVKRDGLRDLGVRNERIELEL